MVWFQKIFIKEKAKNEVIWWAMADVIDQFILIFQSFANPALTTLYKFYPKTAFRNI